MMIAMQDDPSPPAELPLDKILPLRLKNLLESNGIYTVEAAFRAYPDQLLKLPGMGISKFRQLERILFPGETFTPRRVPPPIPYAQGSSLNGMLLPGTVQALARGGITTVAQLRAASRKNLLAIKALGPTKLREIDRLLLLGKSATTVRDDLPIRHIKGSSLNGSLSPAVVRALARGGITTLEQLLAAERKKLMNIRGLGALKLREIESVYFPELS
ncbi:helix-hairpin-helix domain-containing protein [Comamonas sp. B21-038]|uniref:helix-hairpin-helix domain-containing protein n=1 Tax=Comamonas sp. B21-038 TaxID=2918299 RepID=UPI001EFAC228|nr:helix-hairpin-helix domain-containing protein [Comamonas sp. B21-038]ULR90909.1 helix-hairpin-helix domain-containing protein [Comamonas sp. B21-038]